MKDVGNPKIINLLNKKETKNLNLKFKNTLLNYKKKYSRNSSLLDFKKKFVNHESVIMKCIAYSMMDHAFWMKMKKS